MDYARRLSSTEFVPVKEKESVLVESKKADDSILSIIYGLDPVSQLPTGDLQYYVSDKANPEIKQFILDNLMRDVSSAANPPSKINGVTDDMVLEMMRRDGESSQQYMSRLNESVSVARLLNESKLRNNAKSPVSVEPASSAVPSE